MRRSCGAWSRASEPQREVDLMICGAFIEARSCERFAALGAAIGRSRWMICSAACTKRKRGTISSIWT